MQRPYYKWPTITPSPRKPCPNLFWSLSNAAECGCHIGTGYLPCRWQNKCYPQICRSPLAMSGSVNALVLFDCMIAWERCRTLSLMWTILVSGEVWSWCAYVWEWYRHWQGKFSGRYSLTEKRRRMTLRNPFEPQLNYNNTLNITSLHSIKVTACFHWSPKYLGGQTWPWSCSFVFCNLTSEPSLTTLRCHVFWPLTAYAKLPTSG